MYQKYLRQNLRNNMTKEEIKLWKHLKKEQLGVKIRRQHSIGRYIVDFYCPIKKLVIELDGSQHYTEEGKNYDEIRDDFMISLGIKTIRFSNLEIKEDTELVVERIAEELKKIEVKEL